jgi:hypothetical protein
MRIHNNHASNKLKEATPVLLEQEKKQAHTTIYLACIALIWVIFIGLNLRHLFDPFRDYGKPLAGEPFYAIRALNYLRHGYFTHWLGVCNNLNPHPEALEFKFTEMPAYFVTSSLAFRLFGVSSSTFRVVELLYALGLFVSFSLGAWKLFGRQTALLASLVLLLLPVNLFLMYISWSFVFSMLGILFYSIWLNERGRISYSLMLFTAVLGCLHHVAGFFLAPAMLLDAILTRSVKKNASAIIGVFCASAIVGSAYLAQILLLRQNFAAVSTKAVSESLFNLGYLRDFYVLNIGKLTANVRELLGVPLLLISTLWLAKKIAVRKELSAGDNCVVLLLIFPALFFLVFLGMVGSHLHFQTMFGPFLALAVARVLLEAGPKMFRRAIIPVFVVYLALTSYRTQKKYDSMFWSSGNERGYALAQVLRKSTSETDAVAGVPYFGYSYQALPPAFCFYLERDYFEGITTLGKFLELTSSHRIKLFLFPSSAEVSAEAAILGQYLSEHYPSFVDPGRSDMLIFDLQKGTGSNL